MLSSVRMSCCPLLAPTAVCCPAAGGRSPSRTLTQPCTVELVLQVVGELLLHLALHIHRLKYRILGKGYYK